MAVYKKYDYRGYVITEMPDGYFIVNDTEFYSFDDACNWVDELLDYAPLTTDPNPVPELHLYHIFYVTKSYDCGYDEYIQAYSEDEAIRYLKRKHRDIAYIADCYEVD